MPDSANADKTLVMTATYNEIENLPRLVDDVFAAVPEVDFLVVDDNSPDGTGRWCDERAAADHRVRCIHRTGKLGLGTAIVAGMKYATQHGYRYVLNMDADFSHHPRYLPAMIGGMDPPAGPPLDVMIGSRYVPGGGVAGEQFGLRRKLMSRGINAYARLLLGLRTVEGVPTGLLSDLNLSPGSPPVADLMAEGFLTVSGDRLVATPPGRPVLDGVLKALLT